MKGDHTVLHLSMYIFGLVLMMVTLAFGKGPCFTFPGKSFLKFKPNNLNISHQMHYSLQFQTTSPEGILLYSEGPEDYESLYLVGGKLVYLLTNPSPSGVEGTTGGLYISDHVVNTGNWVTVELWRNWESEKLPQRDTVLKTGLEIRDPMDNIEENHLDDVKHRRVLLKPVVYVGGVPPSVKHTEGSATPSFTGRIREIHEERNDIDFELYSRNYRGKVGLCD